jgi:hypothetical protein
VVGDTARKCEAEARFVQIEPFLDEVAEISIELCRAGQTTLIEFSTLVRMIEEQGTLAADFSGVRRIVEVACSFLPNVQPKKEEEAVDFRTHQWRQSAMQQQAIQQHMQQLQAMQKLPTQPHWVTQGSENESWWNRLIGKL